MTFHVCDLPECGKKSGETLPVSLKGYWPSNAGGILLPEYYKQTEFCSRECFLKWMRWALNKEAGVTSVITAVKEPRHPY